jgi:hypothetical protein
MILVTFDYQGTSYNTVCIGDINSDFILDKARSIFNVEITGSEEYFNSLYLHVSDSRYTIKVDFISIDSLSFPSFIPAEDYLTTLQTKINADVDDSLVYIFRKLS